MPQWKQYSGIWTPTQQAQARAAETWTGIPRPELYAWGSHYSYQLGLGSPAAAYSSPVQVGTDIDWQQAATGDQNSIAVKTDGSLWTAGYPDFGVLGNNTGGGGSPYVSLFSQVGALTNWLQVSTSYVNAGAVKTNGTLWLWGRNDTGGQVGDGTIINRSSPVQIGAGTNWSHLAVGNTCAVAIKTDGTLWGWGSSANGRNGLNGVLAFSPVQIGALTTWSKVSHFHTFGFAIKTDGTLWAWGANNNGELGIGDRTTTSSPVQIGVDTDWADVAAGYFNGAGIKTDGTLWVWGYNFGGRLGLNDTASRSSPVQVGALTSWSKVSVGRDGSCAIKNDGTIWAWGYNTYGTNGQNNTTNYSSPVQIGTNTNWSDVNFGNYSVLAINANPTT